MSRPAISQHLRVLKQAELVRDRADGTGRVYEVNPEGSVPTPPLLRPLWTDALAAFKNAVEDRPKHARRGLPQELAARSPAGASRAEEGVDMTMTVDPTTRHPRLHQKRDGTRERGARVPGLHGRHRYVVASGHHLGEAPLDKAVIEPHVNGRCYGRSDRRHGVSVGDDSRLGAAAALRHGLADHAGVGVSAGPRAVERGEVRFTPEPGGLTRSISNIATSIATARAPTRCVKAWTPNRAGAHCRRVREARRGHRGRGSVLTSSATDFHGSPQCRSMRIPWQSDPWQERSVAQGRGGIAVNVRSMFSSTASVERTPASM